MTRAEEQIELSTRLLAMARELGASRTTTMSSETIAVLRDQVIAARGRLLDDDVPRLIDYEATCLVEVMAELTYARTDRSKPREDRALAYLNMLRLLMRIDLVKATGDPARVMQ